MQNSAHSDSGEQTPPSPSTVIKRGRFEGKIYYLVVSSLFVLFAFQLWFHAVRASATYDEPGHILAGYRHLQCGDFSINAEHPPLLKLLAAAPLMSRAFIEPDRDCGAEVNHKWDNIRAGMWFVAKNGTDGVVVPARLAASLMSLLLAATVFFAARQMFGIWESVVALALLVFEPNLIAHGSLVTTDMALTATSFAAVFALYRYVMRPGAFRFLIVGVTVGLTLSAKHSGVLILPILFSILILDVCIFRDTESERRVSAALFRRAAAFAGILLVGGVVLWACYGFRFSALPNAAGNSIPAANFFAIRPEAQDSLTGRAVMKLNRLRVLPEAYNYGMADVIENGSRRMFLFNELYPTARWFYFPVAFAVKTSVALIFSLPVGLLTLGLYRARRREMAFLLVPAFVFFAIGLASPLNIGIRHILPVYPFFIIAAAAGICFWARKYRIVRYASIGLLVLHAATAYLAAPNYLAFSNVFFGGVDGTHRILADSNVEWGQSVKLAREYVARENVADCWFAGDDNVEINRRQQPCRMLPGSAGNWSVTEQLIEPPPVVIEGTILLSVWALPPMSVAVLPRGDEYSPVTRSEPVALIGGSILVYRGRFELPLVAALSHTGRARQLIGMNRFEEAVAEASKAVDLEPGDPNSRVVAGVALARCGRRDEARRELETAIRLAAADPSLFPWAEQNARSELQRMQ